MSSDLFSPLLTFSKLLSALLSWSQLLSAFLAQNLLQNRSSAPKPKKVRFLKGNFTRKMTAATNKKNQQKLIAATLSCVHRSFNLWDFPQKVKVEDVKMTLSCEISLQSWKLKMWKQRFVRDIPQKLKVEVVKMTPEPSVPLWGRFQNDSPEQRLSGTCRAADLPSIFRGTFCAAKRNMPRIRYLSKRISHETFLKKWKLTQWKPPFRARPPSKINFWRCEKEAFVPDVPSKLKVEVVKTTPGPSVPMRGQFENDPPPRPSAVADLPPPSFEALCCETNYFAYPLSLKFAFRARLFSKSEKLTLWNKAFEPDLPQKNWQLKMWNRSFRAGLSSKWKLKLWKRRFRARPPSTARKNWMLKMWKRRFRARPASKTESWRCENEAFVIAVTFKAPSNGCIDF